jgi:Flp pilus assembly protein TadD
MLGLLSMSEGDYVAAATSFKEAIARSKAQFPASHNNLGVSLAKLGRLSEAEREFESAVKQSDGKFDEAAHNLKLCRALLASPEKPQLGLLKTVETTEAPNK